MSKFRMLYVVVRSPRMSYRIYRLRKEFRNGRLQAVRFNH